MTTFLKWLLIIALVAVVIFEAYSLIKSIIQKNKDRKSERDVSDDDVSDIESPHIDNKK